MIRGVPLLALAVMLFTLAACGGTSTPTANVSLDQLPTIQFVGNSSCPTSNAAPYFKSGNDVKPAPVNSLPPVGQAIDEMPHTHVSSTVKVTYLHDPPTSGCHYNLGYGDAPIQTGVYNQAVPKEYWVHNLEHGYIVAWYDSKLPASEVSKLQAMAKDPKFSRLLVVGWWQGDLPSSKHVVLTSWGRTDRCGTVSTPVVSKFYADHLNGSVAPEAGVGPISGADSIPPGQLPNAQQSASPMPSATASINPSPTASK